MVTKREVIGEVLKDQAITNLELLYDELIGGDEYLAKDMNNLKDRPEPSRKPYKSDKEIIRDNDRFCITCRYYNRQCTSNKFKNDVDRSIEECINQDHKYWEEK